MEVKSYRNYVPDEEVWNDLEKGLTDVYIRKEWTSHLYLELYSRIFYLFNPPAAVQHEGSNVNTSRGARPESIGLRMYIHLKKFLTVHVSNIFQQSHGKSGEDLLDFYLTQWKAFEACSQKASDCYLKLDRNYVWREVEEGNLDVYFVYELAVITWREELLIKIQEEITDAVLDVIKRERTGEAINVERREQMKKLVCVELDIDTRQDLTLRLERDNKKSSVYSLNVYKEHFEASFLAKTETFYSEEWARFYSENSTIDYSQYVAHRLVEEIKLCEHYLHLSTHKALLERFNKVFIASKIEILRSEFLQVLENNRVIDLKRLCMLCRRVENGLTEVDKILETHILRQGHKAIEKVKNIATRYPEAYVEAIFEVYKQYSQLVETFFENEGSFVQALERACKTFVNRNCVTESSEQPISTARLLTKYCEILMETRFGESEVEQLFIHAKTVYRYVEDKKAFGDIFANKFSQHLTTSDATANSNEAIVKRIYKMFQCIDSDIKELETKLTEHFEGEGHRAISQLNLTATSDPRAYVKTIFEVHTRFAQLVEKTFDSEISFTRALDKASTAFINRKTIVGNGAQGAVDFSPSWFLAKLLRKTSGNSEEDNIEEQMSQTMTVFKYIEDKDVFLVHYKKFFARRLLSELSISNEMESLMINNLQLICGTYYARKLQIMITDIDLSRESLLYIIRYVCMRVREFSRFSSIEQHESVDKKRIELSIKVLTTGSWPLTPPTTLPFDVPRPLVACIESFKAFYNTQHQGRRPNWLLMQSRGELVTLGLSKRYRLVVTTAQMALLLVFNEYLSTTVKNLAEITKMTREILILTLQSLFKCGLLKAPKDFSECEEDDDSTIDLNLNFSNKQNKIDLTKHVARRESKQEIEKVSENLDADRKLVIQACIVRIMKTRKTAKHQALMAEVLQQLSTRFKPSVPMVKQCIDVLLEKEYLQRVDDDNDSYSYIA